MPSKLKRSSGEESPGVMPVEFEKVVALLAERRGEAPQDTLAAIIDGLIRPKLADPDSFRKFLVVQEAIDARYCEAEGIQDVRRYSERTTCLQLKAALRELLRELRAEPWRKTWPGLLDT